MVENMTNSQPPRLATAQQPQYCAWCAQPLRDESFTVTFPDKAQAQFHITCLYRYREAVQR